MSEMTDRQKLRLAFRRLNNVNIVTCKSIVIEKFKWDKETVYHGHS